jgi:hypothetical protein
MAKTKTLAIIVASVGLFVGACATPTDTTPISNVPDNLKPATNESLAMIVPAKGVQIYECRAKKDETGYEWAFIAPEAELFDAHGRSIGRHYAGPHWEAADGSKVLGALKARADAPTTNAISWLLLSAKSTGPTGSFSKVTSIQRVNTVGGSAPATDCPRGAAGKTVRINYSADYYFFGPK